MKITNPFTQVGFVDKLLFTKHLSIMVKSGITIPEALDTLISQTKSHTFRTILSDVLKDIKNGQSLAKSLKKHPEAFDQFYTSFIEISEESGTLEENLNFLALQLSKEYGLRKKIQGALMYPAIVLTAITVVGAGMSIFVLPKLVDLFTSLEVELPWTTQVLLFVANSMKSYGVFIIGGFFGLLLLFRYCITLPNVKPHWHRFILSLPVLGPFLQNEQMASLCRNLGIMIKSGLSIKRALGVQYEVTTNSVYKTYVYKIQKSVERGKGIEEEILLEHFTKISPIATKMIGVGEKTGKLDEVLLYLGDFFEEEVDNTAKNFSTILEPIILLIIGLVVAFVALAIISPIYQITGSVRR